jgi:transcriptional regulator with XRE-family HTH domain
MAVQTRDWPLGPVLDQWCKTHGYSKRKVADLSGLSDATIRSLISGYTTGGHPYHTTVATLTKLADGIGFPLKEAAELAGLDLPAEYLATRSAPIASWTFDEMLSALRGRFLAVSQQAAADTLPPVTKGQIRGRMRTVARLNELADQLVEIDADGAGIIRELSTQLDAQLEAVDDNGDVRESRPNEVR